MVHAVPRLALLLLAAPQSLELLCTHKSFYLLMSLLLQLVNFLPLLLWREGAVATNRLDLAAHTLVNLTKLRHHRLRNASLLPTRLRTESSPIGGTSRRTGCCLCQQRTNQN